MPKRLLRSPDPARRRIGPSALSLCAVSLLATFTSQAQAQTNTPPTRSITLDECVQMALTNNLDLRIDRVSPLIAQADLDIARAGYDPNFTFNTSRRYNVSGGGLDSNKLPIPGSRSTSDSFSSGITGLGLMGMSYNLSGQVAESYGTSPLPFDNANGSISLSMTQPLLRNFLFDSTRYNIAVARNQLKVSDLRLKNQIMTVVATVEQAYFDLISARESLKVQEKALQLAQRLANESRKRVSIGTLARLEEKQAEAETAARQTDLFTAQNTLLTAQNSLKRLISANFTEIRELVLDPSEQLSSTPVALSLQESWTRGLSQRPDLLQSRLDVERQGITLKYLKNQRLPQLDVTGSYGFGASGNQVHEFSDAFNDFHNGNKPAWSVGGVFSIPIGNRAARTRYRQGKMTADQLVLELKRLEETILVDIDESINRVRSSLEKIHSTREARIYAETALEAEQKKLAAGSSTSYQVLQLQRDLTSARSEEIRALTDYNKALSQLNLNEASTLERRKIGLEIK